jgi:hypothetical protein
MRADDLRAAKALVKRRTESNRASIEREINLLRQRFEQGPAPGETLAELGERLVRQLAVIFSRYTPLAPPKRGRPRTSILAGPSRPRGRPPKFDSKQILALVDARRDATLRDKGRRVRRGTALCELLAEAIEARAKRGEPVFQAKYRRYQSFLASYQVEHSPAVARRRALMRVDGNHLRKLERILSHHRRGDVGTALSSGARTSGEVPPGSYSV